MIVNKIIFIHQVNQINMRREPSSDITQRDFILLCTYLSKSRAALVYKK